MTVIGVIIIIYNNKDLEIAETYPKEIYSARILDNTTIKISRKNKNAIL